MTYKDINVFQWQQIVSIDTTDLSQFEYDIKLIAIAHNKTLNEIDSLPLSELHSLFNSTQFLEVELQPKPVKYIKVNGKRYRCIYDVRKIPAARYIESKHFGTDVPGNLHRIAASLVIPQKRTIFGWKDDKYDASKHEEYAQDLLSAPIEQVYGSVVFFYHVFKNWIKNSQDYLKKALMEGKMSKEESQSLVSSLCDIMDGSSSVPLLRKWNA